MSESSFNMHHVYHNLFSRADVEDLGFSQVGIEFVLPNAFKISCVN